MARAGFIIELVAKAKAIWWSSDGACVGFYTHVEAFVYEGLIGVVGDPVIFFFVPAPSVGVQAKFVARLFEGLKEGFIVGDGPFGGSVAEFNLGVEAVEPRIVNGTTGCFLDFIAEAVKKSEGFFVAGPWRWIFSRDEARIGFYVDAEYDGYGHGNPVALI